jgi:hypothetical protein
MLDDWSSFFAMTGSAGAMLVGCCSSLSRQEES